MSVTLTATFCLWNTSSPLPHWNSGFWSNWQQPLFCVLLFSLFSISYEKHLLCICIQQPHLFLCQRIRRNALLLPWTKLKLLIKSSTKLWFPILLHTISILISMYFLSHFLSGCSESIATVVDSYCTSILSITIAVVAYSFLLFIDDLLSCTSCPIHSYIFYMP